MNRAASSAASILLCLPLLAGCLQAERIAYAVRNNYPGVRAEMTYYNLWSSDTSALGLQQGFETLLEQWRGESRLQMHAQTWSVFIKSRRVMVENGVLVARESLFCDGPGTLFAMQHRGDTRPLPDRVGVELVTSEETGFWVKGDILSANVAFERRGDHNLIWWPDSLRELRVVFKGAPASARASADLLARFLAWKRAHPEMNSSGNARVSSRRTR